MFFSKNRLFDIRLQIGTHVLIHQIICFLSWLDRFNKMLSFFCFSKLEAPLFSFFLSRSETSISGENPCFPISGGHVHPPTTKTWIFTIMIFWRKSKKCDFGENWCFSGGWVYITSRDRKTWIFTGNGRFRTRQKKPEKRSSQLWETKKWEHFQIWGKLTFFEYFLCTYKMVQWSDEKKTFLYNTL